MEHHLEILHKMCRICGESTETDCRDKMMFYREFGELYGLELNLDEEGIHPPKICRVHSAMMYRYRKAKETGQVFKTDHVPMIFFEPHSSNCRICAPVPKKVGRKKRKIAPKGSIAIDTSLHSISAEPTIPSSSTSGSNTPKFCFEFLDYISGKTTEEKNVFLHALIDLLDDETLIILANQLGKVLRKHIYEDATSFFYMYKDLDHLSNFDVIDWLNRRNPMVKSLLIGICSDDKNADLPSMPHDHNLRIAKSVEQIYNIRMPSLISPLSFLQNISVYTQTGSKLAVDLLGSCSPAGQYKAITNWLQVLGNKEPILPDGDLFNVFDNEQVVGRKNIIKPGNKAAVSIITNKGVVQLNDQCSLQDKLMYKPFQILKANEIFQNVDVSEQDENETLLDQGNKFEETKENAETRLKLQDVVNNMINQSDEYHKHLERLHYEQLYYFVDESISQVKEEQVIIDGKMHDWIDEKILSSDIEDLTIKCARCGTLNTRRKQVCIGCNEREGIKETRETKKSDKSDSRQTRAECKPSYKKMVFRRRGENETTIEEVEVSAENTSKSERFANVESFHSGYKEILLTDPTFCNPNSFETVSRVLRQIGEENGISRYGGQKRHWTFLCCDGIPFMICKTLKEEAVVCTVNGCSTTCINKGELKKHMRKEHPNETNLQYYHEFDWFYLRIGGGHYEMNLVKSFFELNWVPFLEVMCMEMGFVSDAAKHYAKACKDHHKSWTLLLILHFSFLRELVLPFVRDCMENGTVSSCNAKTFFQYSSTKYGDKNMPTYKYIIDQILRFSQGIINFRMATRRNNAELLRSAKFMTKELFHGRNHPKYQEIEIYDNIQYLMMPEEVKDLYDSFTSFTTTGNKSTGEDLDFLLEEKNRQLKRWIPKGLPSDEIWQNVCRNNQVLEHLKKNTCLLFNIKLENHQTKNIDIEEAVNAFRLKIRKSDYLSTPGTHISLDGKPLDHMLHSFLEKSTEKRLFVLHANILQKPTEEPFDLRYPVPITPSEREKLIDINNMTKAKIEAEIEDMIGVLANLQDDVNHRNHFQSSIKGKNKTVLLMFYQQLKEELESFLEGNDIQSEQQIEIELSSTVDNVPSIEKNLAQDLMQ